MAKAPSGSIVSINIDKDLRSGFASFKDITIGSDFIVGENNRKTAAPFASDAPEGQTFALAGSIGPFLLIGGLALAVLFLRG